MGAADRKPTRLRALVRAGGRSVDGHWNRRGRCATDLPAEREPSVPLRASTSNSPRCLWISWSLFRAGDQCGNALGYGRPQRSRQVMTHAVDHDQLRFWNRFCGRLPAAHVNDRVLSAVNDKGRQVEPAQDFVRSGV
jgi:hypothetical protein